MENHGQDLSLIGAEGTTFAMLWVLALMVAVVVAFVGKRTNERKMRMVGYEIEMIKGQRYHDNVGGELGNMALALHLTEHGVATQSHDYTHQTTAHTKIVPDTSLSDGGTEVVSPPLTKSARRTWLAGVHRALKGLIRFDSTTSVHFHEGLRAPNTMFDQEGQMSWSTAQRTAVLVQALYGKYEKAIWTILPSSRRGNDYAGECHVFYARLRDEILLNEDLELNEYYSQAYQLGTNDRYYAVNITSVRRYGTIEFRAHGGSINPVKLDAWSQLMGALTTRAMTMTNDEVIEEFGFRRWATPRIDDIQQLGDFLGFSPKSNLMRYYARRVIEIQGDSQTKPCESCESFTCAGCIANDTEQNSWQHVIGSYEATDHYRQWRIISGWDDEDDGEYGISTGLFGLVMGVAFGLAPLVIAVAVTVGCGIGAIHGAGKKYNYKNRLKHLWVLLSSRGKQAAGMAWKKPKRSEVHLYLKDAQSSEALQANVRRHIDEETLFATLHTRFATHGKNNAENAHPHFSSQNKVCMVHNGVLSNDMEVWKALERKPTGPVDSQAIAEALEVGGIEKVVETCKGTMSLIWSDTRDPNGTLHFWTNGGNPLVFGRLDRKVATGKNAGGVVVASTEEIAKQSMGKRLKTLYDCAIGRKYTIHPDGEITHIDIDGSLETNEMTYWTDWRNYDTVSAHGQKSTITKVTGDADNCALPNGTTVRVTTEDLFSCWDIGNMDDSGGWKPYPSENGIMLHGYDAKHHMGITPEGTRYELPNYVQPFVDEGDRMELVAGMYEEHYPISQYDQSWVDDWMHR